MKFRSPMLASDYDPARLVFPVLASPKLDGIRAVVDLDAEGRPGLYTRSGKLVRNAFVQKTLALEELEGLDGELIVGDPAAPDVYHRTSSGIMSANGEPDFTFQVFDDRALGESLTYSQRLVVAKAKVYHAFSRVPQLRLLEQRPILTSEQFELQELEYLAAGYEGMMIRRDDTVYKFGRSTPKGAELLKVKRVATNEAVIVGVVEQMGNENEAFMDELGRTKRSTAKEGLVPAGTLGAFVCKAEHWEGTFNVGPGVLTAAQRKAVWDGRDAVVGHVMTFIRLIHGAKDKPRHGRFLGFRESDDLS